MLYGNDKLGNNHCILGGYLLARWPVFCEKSFCVSSNGENKLWQESEKHTSLTVVIAPVVLEVGESCFIFSVLSSFYTKHIYLKHSSFNLALILNLVIDINVVLDQRIIDMLQIRKTNA